MVMQKITPQLCFEMMQAHVNAVAELIRTAPLSEQHRKGLAILVTTNFLAIASIIDTDRSDDNKAAQDVCDLIMAAIKLEPAKAKKPDLHLVKDDAG